MTADEVEAVLRRRRGAARDALIPILQEVQAACGYLPRDAIILVGRRLNLPASKVYGVATFYDEFRFRPPGRFHVRVCRGTGCHVKESLGVLEVAAAALGLKPGETSRDGLFSLEAAACLGACARGPVMVVNGRLHAAVSPESVKAILDGYRARASDDAAAHG
jgi:NADH-quinone oxidoreductase subunit E